MRGFMCQSPAATVVCMTGDSRSVIVPRRPDRKLVDHSRFMNATKYSRVVDSPGTPLGDRRSASEPSIKRAREREPNPSRNCNVPASLTLSNHVFQVVVMRVALHCQGCAGKVKKHLSKMEGVTSYSIDLETKMVTVMGHVSPEGVLESISKVKKAEFWPC
ncbi:hypothetical protein HHK36_030648 [Tetracentron sinense]|uniref:HMA domain-containing protein n=1 Tax=Tetracentron sinense TaxID=13715 RepID=A0A834Y7X8_TETSI|nr:hypothetical protein HHK36_030648 [Tetracentron sinense]